MRNHHQRHIQLFEHDSIRVGEVRDGHTFTEADWNYLLKLNERQYPPYLQPIHRGIRTLHYVGLIQLPGLCLEILPKTDRAHSSQNRHLLLHLLSLSQKIPAIQQANFLKAAKGSLSDYFISQFLEACDQLCRKGLVNKYRQETGNFSRFRGKMLVREHVRHNHAHKERVYAEYQAYDNRHSLHMLIVQALGEVSRLSREPEILCRSKQLMTEFPDCGFKMLGDEERKKIHLTQEDQYYTRVIQWANLILDNLSPSLQSGDLACSAFLFDMQQLFEEVVARELAAATREKGHTLQLQPSRHFWRQRRIRPDMVLKTKEGETIILDTKWKLLRNHQPDESDLKQMYIYNRFFEAQRGVLIYPAQSGFGNFGESYQQHASEEMRCEIVFVDLWDQDGKKFKLTLGQELLQHLLKKKEF